MKAYLREAIKTQERIIMGRRKPIIRRKLSSSSTNRSRSSSRNTILRACIETLGDLGIGKENVADEA